MAGVIEVLIVDDHPVVASGLAESLERDAEVHVVAVAPTLAEARAALERYRPDIAIVDIRLGDESGLDLLDPNSVTSWIVLSSFDTPQYIATARARGASGYLLKSSPTEAILAAVKRVASGGLAFDPEVLERETVSGRWRPLSKREREVVRLVIEGCSNDDVGRRLGISRKTVESHLAHLYDRYDVRSRAELAARAEREGWLYLPTA